MEAGLCKGLKKVGEIVVDPVDPSKNPETHGNKPADPAASHKAKGPPPQYGKVSAKPMEFLGMHFTGPEAEKLWNIMLRQIGAQIQKEQAKALKALRKLRKSSTGEG